VPDWEEMRKAMMRALDDSDKAIEHQDDDASEKDACSQQDCSDTLP
jgi:hypothetical protein